MLDAFWCASNLHYISSANNRSANYDHFVNTGLKIDKNKSLSHKLHINIAVSYSMCFLPIGLFVYMQDCDIIFVLPEIMRLWNGWEAFMLLFFHIYHYKDT